MAPYFCENSSKFFLLYMCMHVIVCKYSSTLEMGMNGCYIFMVSFTKNVMAPCCLTNVKMTSGHKCYFEMDVIFHVWLVVTLVVKIVTSWTLFC